MIMKKTIKFYSFDFKSYDHLKKVKDFQKYYRSVERKSILLVVVFDYWIIFTWCMCVCVGGGGGGERTSPCRKQRAKQIN